MNGEIVRDVARFAGQKRLSSHLILNGCSTRRVYVLNSLLWIVERAGRVDAARLLVCRQLTLSLQGGLMSGS